MAEGRGTMTSIANRLAKLEAEINPVAEGRQFTFSGGPPDADLDAFALTFGVILTEQDKVIHHTISAGAEHVGELTLAHCSDEGVMIGYAFTYAKSIMPLDGSDE
jgi:S-adenosylmethionine synthetase